MIITLSFDEASAIIELQRKLEYLQNQFKSGTSNDGMLSDVFNALSLLQEQQRKARGGQ